MLYRLWWVYCGHRGAGGGGRAAGADGESPARTVLLGDGPEALAHRGGLAGDQAPEGGETHRVPVAERLLMHEVVADLLPTPRAARFGVRGHGRGAAARGVDRPRHAHPVLFQLVVADAGGAERAREEGRLETTGGRGAVLTGDLALPQGVDVERLPALESCLGPTTVS